MAERRARTRGSGRVAAVLAGAVAACLVLAGCIAIPTDGPVLEGRSGQQEQSDPRIIAAPPPRGAAPSEIVRGFLLAAGDQASSSRTQGPFARAREYLVRSRATEWRPESGTVVYSGQYPDLAVVADGREVPGGSPVGPEVAQVQVTGQVVVVATIDGSGRYATAPAGTVRDVSFTLVREQGQWRISELADGLLLAESLLTLVYRSYDLYFLDPSGRVLVPETRWFLSRESNPTTLARELLAGPSPWLQGALRSSIPVGTGLARPGSVRVEDGVAFVDLSSGALQTSRAQRSLMLAQLRATLLPVPDVDAVTITVEGAEIDVPASPAALVVDPGVDVSPVLVADGRLARLGPGDAVTPVEGLPDLSGLAVSDPGLSYQETVQRYAVLTGAGSQLLLLTPGLDDELPDPVLTGTDLTAPSFDRFRWVWSTPAASTGSVTAVSPEGQQVDVAAHWLSGRRVTSLRVSRDGTRVVVTSTDAQGAGHVEVAGVVRDDQLTPVTLSPQGPLSIGARLTSASQAVWLDDSTVAALGTGPDDDTPRVHVLRIGGRDGPPLSPVEGPAGLAAGAGEGSMLLATTAGTLVERAGAAWVPLALPVDVARDPAFAG